jgi:hypothetical protein
MHQPTIPAGVGGELISHLQYMLDHPGEGDNHNAEPFAHCYRRLADLIPQLIAEGCDPRIMLDYSGNLLWGFEQMGRREILDALRFLATDPSVQPHVEWLGTFWSHAVAPSTPIPDLKLQILAWQHHFAALFGDAALQRVKGFSPPEMALPNHPDTLYELVKALRECGYRWLLVQEHSVENPDGSSLRQEQKVVPNQLVARNSRGEEVSIIALIKTQGSDTKLVGQMQPCYEALGLDRQALGNTTVPAIVQVKSVELTPTGCAPSSGSVMTTLPEKKHSSTTGDASGRKMRPGNMVRWYMQCSSSLPYMPCRSSMPAPTGSSTCATMFCTSQLASAKAWLGNASRRMRQTCRPASAHSYQFRPPVTTSFPLPNRSVVQSGDRNRIVMAANRFRS